MKSVFKITIGRRNVGGERGESGMPASGAVMFVSDKTNMISTGSYMNTHKHARACAAVLAVGTDQVLRNKKQK